MSLSVSSVALSPRFQALADPSRLRILSLLRAMELAVGELALILGQSQPRVSHHVRVLDEAKLIERRKEGSWVYLGLSQSADPEALFALIERWLDADSAAQFDSDRARLDGIRAERAEAARRYFEAHAATWDSIRSLHVAECEIEQAIASALSGEPLGALLDIGTGTGRMLELFADEAEGAIGVDRSLPLADHSVDSIILHQVLHYAQTPGSAVSEAARVLRPGGRLLVIDFAQHDREELRNRDAHLRLGFADDAMRGWFGAAGLEVDRIDRLEGGELTVILWRGRKAGAARSTRKAA